jgi:hypothetical protein
MKPRSMDDTAGTVAQYAIEDLMESLRKTREELFSALGDAPREGEAVLAEADLCLLIMKIALQPESE